MLLVLSPPIPGRRKAYLKRKILLPAQALLPMAPLEIEPASRLPPERGRLRLCLQIRKAGDTTHLPRYGQAYFR